MANNKLLIVAREQEEFRDEIARRNLPKLDISAPLSADDIRAAITDANILLANPLCVTPFLSAAKKLQWVQCTFTGVDALLSSGLRRDYILTNVRDAYGEIIAEYVFTYIFHVEKKVDQFLAQQQNRLWDQCESLTVKNKVIGVLGAGSIGKQIARIAKAFGMTTFGFRRTNTPAEYFDQIFTAEDAQNFYKACDYIVAALPQTKATNGIVNREAFALMKPSVIFVNVGRGGAVVEADLINALNRGIIRTAVIDVFPTEPLPTESPLWDVPNLIITPHVSGYYNSKRIFDIFAENYSRFLEGAPLVYQVDFEQGY